MIIVYTSGVFDILHKGHLYLLKRARALGDFLVVGIQNDKYAMVNKSKPILTINERVDQIEALSFVDRVIIYGSGEDTSSIERVTPAIMVQGDDWEKTGRRKKVIRYLKTHNIKLILLPRTTDISTTEIKRRIKNGSL